MTTTGTPHYDGKVVVVTGASRGVGHAVSRYFLRHGARVIGFARGGPTIDDAAYTHFAVDIGNAKEVQDAFRQIANEFPTVDIVINNAAVLTSQYAMILPAHNAQEMVNTNLLGTFFVSREAAKIMRKAKTGRIINIGSMAARLEPMGDSIYAACKAAVSTLANVMAKEFSSFNVTCNTLGITAIDTDMLAQLPRDKVDAIVAALPVPRYATEDDIFNVLDFFAAERSAQITAQTVFLGGVN